MPVLLLALAHAATLDVCPAGCDATTVQGAVDLAATGDVIALAPGLYRENVVVDGKSITVVGADPDTTVLDGGGVDTVVLVTATGGLVLEGVTVQSAPTSGRLPGSAGVHTLAGPLTLRSCVVTGNGTGVAAWNRAPTTIEASVIAHNHLHGVDASTPDLHLVQSTVVGNGRFGLTSSWGGGVLDLRYDVFAHNGWGAVEKRTADGLVAEYNLTWRNGEAGTNPFSGAWLDFDGRTHVAFDPGPTNLVGDPLLGAACDRFELQPGSAAIDAGDPARADVDGSRQDLGATGGPTPIPTTRTSDRVCAGLTVATTPTGLVFTPRVTNTSGVALPLDATLSWRALRGRVVAARGSFLLGARGFETADVPSPLPPPGVAPVLACLELREQGLGLLDQPCVVVDP